ncbi:DNA polymerase IV [Pseudoxanthomonas suwonensis]|uniref:DNA polymerase IV n=1 Tax=Pseudoxanthomonas suwonensis TaxID=314722 RepID=UPI00138F0199|nr:DNA polymerase IV [Pseudoxanthomonas suwonensis]KAF1704404.1 DNA polymerase IV [Pseudoxanthomonas suwonensis]
MQAPPVPAQRKIIHVDMDAFYASVEQRDDPSLRGRPVVVAWRGARSVVCAASYEARKFGVRSAMPALRAERLCPDAVFVPPDFVRYKAVSRQVRQIMLEHTDLVEPLSLDEAYLDVTSPKTGLPSATAVAEAIRARIRAETGLTASAGVAPNKFLAKIASDWDKPDGLFVIRPQHVERFLTPLPVERIPGVGKVMQGKLAQLGIATVGDLRAGPLEELQQRFGSFGAALYRRARGIDERPVEPDQPVRSVSSEDTFAEDLPLEALEPAIRQLAEKTWNASRRAGRTGHTVVLKLKTAQFRILTRSLTLERPPASAAELAELACALRERVSLAADTRYRLVGVGLSGFRDADEAAPQGDLFDDLAAPAEATAR